jgi:hypothetical protein
MPIRTLLSEDATSAALNTRAHAPEHCAIDPESLRALNTAVGRQVLVTRSAKRLALYTVAARIGVAGRRRGSGRRRWRASRPERRVARPEAQGGA